MRLMPYIFGGARTETETPFDPGNVTGLILWLTPDAEQIFTDTGGTSEVTSDGQSVARWNDVSGQSNNALQSTAGSRPLYKTGIQNSLPMMRFDGSDDFLISDAIGGLIDGTDQPFTVAIVYKHTATGQSGLYWSGSYSGSDNPYTWGQRVAGGTPGLTLKKQDNVAVSVTNTTAAADDTTAHVAIWRHNGTTVDLWRDGTQLITAEACNVGAQTLDRFTLGCLRLSSNSNFLTGQIGEVLVYTEAISDTNVTNLQTYLETRWATP